MVDDVTSPVTDLASWLLEQIDRDEEMARAELADYDEPIEPMLQSLHQLRWDPTHVLAECESKRSIVREHGYYAAAENAPSYRRGRFCETCAGGSGDGALWPCNTLMFLADPYRDRDGYRPDWSTA